MPLPPIRTPSPALEPEPEECCVGCDEHPDAGEALHFEMRTPPAILEVRCCDKDVGRDFLIGIGVIEKPLAGQHRTKPFRGPVQTVQLKNEHGKPTGDVRVAVSWTPRSGPPHLFCVTVCSASHLKAMPGQHLDPYCTVRVGVTTLRTRTVVDGAVVDGMVADGRNPEWKPFCPTGVATRGTPRTAQGYHKLPILYGAADRGDVEEVKRALKAGVIVSAAPEGRHGNTALHRAAAAGHVAVVKELLRARDGNAPDINAKTDEGWTPYHCACHSGQNLVVKFLLHKKCDTHAVNNWGKTGLDYAMEQHHDHVVRVLEMQGAPRGEVRAKTPPKVVERELGRVAERRHWVQQLLNRHAADRYVDTPCQHEGVVAEVLQANRNRGFVADNHYDIRASMQALAAATSSPAFCLPELLPSVILWRALTHCVTHPSSDASTAGLQDTDGGIPHTASKQQAETIDQEWRKVLDRGLYFMSKLFQEEVGTWEFWRRAREQQPFLPQTLGDRLVFCVPSPPSQMRIRLFSRSPYGKDVELGTTNFFRPTHLEDGTWLKPDEPWDRQMDVRLSSSDSTTGTVTCCVDWNPEPIKPIPKKKLRVIILAAQSLAAGSFLEGRNDPYIEVLVSGAQPARVRTTTAVDGGTDPCWGEPAGRGEEFVFEFEVPEEDPHKHLPVVKLICWDEDENSQDDNLGEGEVQIADMSLEHAWSRHDKVQLWNKKRKAAGRVHLILQYWDTGLDPEPEYPELRRLRVTIFAAKDLPKKDMFGRNDPYARVSVDQRRQRTSTVYAGGSSPSWRDGRGESLVWCIGADEYPSEPSTVEVVLFDEDQGSQDDMIGSGTLNIGRDPDRPWISLDRDEHLQLVDRRQKPAGSVHVLVQSWDPEKWQAGDEVLARHTEQQGFQNGKVVKQVERTPLGMLYEVEWEEADLSGRSNVLGVDVTPRLPPMRLLRVTIIRAQDLPKMDTFGATDPYVQVEVDGTIVRTTTAQDGGANASWGDGKGEVFDFDCMSAPQRINIRCFDEDLDADDEIGKGRLEIAAGAPSEEPWYREEMVTLRSKDKKMRSRGQRPKIFLTVQWFPKPPLPQRRVVDVTILAAKELDSMDLTSANDVYVEVTLGSDTQRTTIIDDGGSDCKWNDGSGETLSFDSTMAGIPTIHISAWDFDVGSANDLIGSAMLNLRDRDADINWTYDSWVKLTRKGKVSGQVHVNIVWDSNPEEPQRRAVRATFLAARDLPKADVFGQNDVYAELTVDDTALRTSVLYDGGSSPSWGESGEILECFPCTTGIPIIQVKLFDEDVGSADDELGTALLNFKKCLTKDQWEEQDWFPLRTKHGKHAGAVHLKVAWDGDPPKPKRRGVRVTIMSAKNLPKADSFGENDCYAQVSFGGTVCKTSVLYGGGCNPRWGSGSDGEVLEAFPEVCGIPTFEIKLFDEDVGSADDELGAAMLNLRAHNPDQDFEEEGWWPLKCKGKHAAEVQVAIQWLADPPKPARRSVCVIIKAARGLRKADIVGENDVYVQANISGMVGRTSVVAAGGASPSWGEEGEILDFCPECAGIPTLQLTVYDEDVGSADDELGVTQLNLRSHMPDDGWTEEGWWPLKHNGKDAGELHAVIIWDPCPPPPKRRIIAIGVLEVRNLPSMDIAGANDPYICVEVNGETHRTRTIDGGGAACSWEGELFQFEVETWTIPPIFISCFDDDGINAADKIGEYRKVPPECRRQNQNEQWSVGLEEELWLPLHSSAHKAAGECRVSVEWIAEPPDRETRRLVVTVLEADGLPKQDRFGQNDPYCICSVNGMTERTKTVEGGGTAPVWGFGSGEELRFVLQTAVVPTVTFSVFDEDEASSDDLIGSCMLRPNQKCRDAASLWERDELLELIDKHGHDAGRLHVLLRWEPAPDINTTSMNRALGVTVFHAHVDTDQYKRGEQLYCAVMIDGTNQRTILSNDDDTMSWGKGRPGYEQLEYLRRQQEQIRGLGSSRRSPDIERGDVAEARVLMTDAADSRLHTTQLWDFAQHLDIHCTKEPHLLWIAEEAMSCKLPHGWEEVEHGDASYFAHRVLGLTQWEHPLDPYFHALVTRARESIHRL